MTNFLLLQEALQKTPALTGEKWEIQKGPHDNGDYTIVLHSNGKDDHELLVPALLDHLRISTVRYTQAEQHIIYDGTTSTNKKILLYGSAD